MSPFSPALNLDDVRMFIIADAVQQIASIDILFHLRHRGVDTSIKVKKHAYAENLVPFSNKAPFRKGCYV